MQQPDLTTAALLEQLTAPRRREARDADAGGALFAPNDGLRPVGRSARRGSGPVDGVLISTSPPPGESGFRLPTVRHGTLQAVSGEVRVMTRRCTSASVSSIARPLSSVVTAPTRSPSACARPWRTRGGLLRRRASSPCPIFAPGARSGGSRPLGRRGVRLQPPGPSAVSRRPATPPQRRRERLLRKDVEALLDGVAMFAPRLGRVLAVGVAVGSSGEAVGQASQQTRPVGGTRRNQLQRGALRLDGAVQVGAAADELEPLGAGRPPRLAR